MNGIVLQLTLFSIGMAFLFGFFSLPAQAVPTLVPILGVFGLFLVKIIFFGASVVFFSLSTLTKGRRKYYTIAATVSLLIGIIVYYLLR